MIDYFLLQSKREQKKKTEKNIQTNKMFVFLTFSIAIANKNCNLVLNVYKFHLNSGVYSCLVLLCHENYFCFSAFMGFAILHFRSIFVNGFFLFRNVALMLPQNTTLVLHYFRSECA